MAKANLTCTTSWTSSMLLAWTSPRRPPSNTVKLTMLRRNSASSMRLYPLSNKQSRKTTVKYGQTDDVEKKFCKFDEVVSLVQQAVKEPEHTGNYHDYVELCKLYDKNENGTMMLAELETFLSLMGDEIPKEDCAK